MLRDRFQAALQELEDLGQQLLERLESFDTNTLCPAQPERLRSALERRRQSLERLGGLSRAHRDLPGAGNLERAQLAAAIDHLLDGLGRRSDALSRLARAERAYHDRIEQLSAMDWPPHERAELRALADNAQALTDLLERGADQAPK